MANEREKMLEDVLAQMLKPLKGIPFEVIVKSICDHDVIPFDPKDSENNALLDALSKAMEEVCRNIQEAPIMRPRPNEVGNDLEPHVASALTKQGYSTIPAKTKSGKGKNTAYPDLFVERKGTPIYIEVKSYGADNHETTQRSFYLSPSDDPKVAHDAHHLVVGFEIVDNGSNGKTDNRGRELRNYVPVGFTIADIYGMACDMKAEFNSDNRRMYEKDRILVERRVSPK